MEFFTTNGNGMIALLSLLSIGLFLVIGASKMYESILGVILGLSLYLMILSFYNQSVGSEATMIGENIISGWIRIWLSMAIMMTITLGIITPLSRIFSVFDIRRGSITNIFKICILGIFYVFFLLAVLSVIVYQIEPFSIRNSLTLIQNMSWWQALTRQSSLFEFIATNSLLIILLGFLLIIYKILFSRMIGRVGLGILGGSLLLRNIIPQRERGSREYSVVEEDDQV